MYKLIPLDKEEYDNYITKLSKNTTYLQSYSWGEFSKIKKKVNVYYLGLINENDKLLAATILYEKLLKFNCSYFYIPSGYVIDYKNKEILKIFTEKILEFIKKKKPIYLEISPNTKNKEINDFLKEIGFIKINKKGKNIYQLNKTNINKIKDIINVKLNDCNNKDIEYEISIGNKNNVKDLFNLIVESNISKHDFDYYDTLYEIFSGNKQTKIILLLTKLNINKTIKLLEKKLKTIVNQISIIPIDNLNDSSKDKLNKLKKQKNEIAEEIEKYKEYRKKYGQEKIINIKEIIIFNKKAYLISSINDVNINIEFVNLNIYKETINYLEQNDITDLTIIGNKKEPLEKVNLIGTYRFIINKFKYNLYSIFNKNSIN